LASRARCSRGRPGSDARPRPADPPAGRPATRTVRPASKGA
jgi:hypothetical protein